MADVVSYPDKPYAVLRRRLATCTSKACLTECDIAHAKLLPTLTEDEASDLGNLLARAHLRVAVAEALG